jgi:Flp pilus assembly protein TadD
MLRRAAEVLQGIPKVQRPARQKSNYANVAERARELTVRGLRLRRKGDPRRGVASLREACALDETDAARWMLLGDLLARVGRREEAERAMKQAVYLRERRGERAKANVVRRLLLNLAGTSRS